MLISILKTIRLFNKLVFSKNNNNRLALRKYYGDSKVKKFGISNNGIEHNKKLGKLFKLRKSKSKKIFKF